MLSLYSGADNLGDGVIQAGHEIVMCIEKDKDCCKTIKLNHPDIEVINGLVSDHLSVLPKVDCVVGGPPCPEFSRAKSDRTFDLCEVNNFRKAVEITKAKHHFMENVQDIYQVHKERNFLINCADYGVPQTRLRRIFTDLPLPKATHSEFPSADLFGNQIKKWVSVKDALGLEGIIQDRKTVFGEYGRFREYSTDKPSNTLVTDSRQFFILDKTQQCWKQKIPLGEIDKPSKTILCDNSDNGLWFVSPTGFSEKNKKQISRSIDEPSQTIVNGNDMQFTDKPVMSTKYKQFKNDYNVIRKLTNEELAILQGFRSDFKFQGSKSSVKRQIGNALPSIISKSFFLELKKGITLLTECE